MLKSVEHQLSIIVLDTETSAVSAEWTQNIKDHALKITISGTVPYNLMMASKLSSNINTQISRVICQHMRELEQVE